MGLLALAGWLSAAALAVAVTRLRMRLELVARAEHELRGPLTAFGLALHAARGTPAGRRLAVVLDAELARARAGLADLAAARRGRRAEPVREAIRADALLRSSGAAWDMAARARGRRVSVRSTAGPAIVHGDRARLAQALGNVMANAVEHGDGDVSVLASRAGDRLRIEVTNATLAAGDGAGAGAVEPAEHGRGLEIAADAAADSGGSLSAAIGPRRARAVLDLPLER
jgi:signal transduction histidine kinase